MVKHKIKYIRQLKNRREVFLAYTTHKSLLSLVYKLRGMIQMKEKLAKIHYHTFKKRDINVDFNIL